MMLSICLYIFILFAPVHDVPIANYKVFVEEYNVKIELEIHTTDVKGIVLKNEFFNYIKNNTAWKINSTISELEFCKISEEGMHTILTFYIYPTNEVKHMEIVNNTFVNELEDFSNIYYINQKSKEVRGFRSHIDRRTVQIEL